MGPTIRYALALAARLVKDAEEASISVLSVTVHATMVRLHAEDPGLTPALAVALGLTTRRVYPDDPKIAGIEFFEAEIDGIHVSTHGPIPACGLAEAVSA